MSNPLEERGSALEAEYFRKQEQELIARMKAKLAEEEAHATKMHCPRCDGTLVETEFEHIHIDVCDKCSGAWFDAGELAQIVGKSQGGWLKRFFG